MGSVDRAPRGCEQQGEDDCRDDRPDHLDTARRLGNGDGGTRISRRRECGAKYEKLGDDADSSGDPEDRLSETLQQAFVMVVQNILLRSSVEPAKATRAPVCFAVPFRACQT